MPSPTSAPTTANDDPGRGLEQLPRLQPIHPHSATTTCAPRLRSCATAFFAAATGSAALSGSTRAG